MLTIEDRVRALDTADRTEAVKTIGLFLTELEKGAVRAASRDEDGFAKLQEVGQIAGNRSSFDVRNYGYKRLSDLMRATGDHFKLERRDNQLYVKRVR